MELALKRFEEVYFVAEPGDALFFHALLCVSAAASFASSFGAKSSGCTDSSRGNFSDERRLAFASCYTRENNIQYKDAYIPCFPCPVLPDDAIIADGKVHLTSEE